MDKEQNINIPRKEPNWVSRIGAKTQPPETPKIEDEQHLQDKDDVATLRDYIAKAHEQVEQTDYFRRRGLSQSTIDRFKLGYDSNFRTKEGVEFVTWQAVIIPTSEYSYTARNTELSAELHNRIRKKGPGTIYNLAALQSGQPVFIVEGEIDALSLVEAGAEALALSSTANISQLIKALGKEVPAAGLVISLDNDENGRRTTAELSQALKLLNINYIEANICGEYKDPNEALTMARAQFIQAVQATQESLNEQRQAAQQAEREAYLNNCSSCHLRDFTEGIKESASTSYIPTGFNQLDRLLDGGFYKGLYILGAPSSLGKTSFALQAADHIAQTGKDVLLFSLETARVELMAMSISRLTFAGADKTGKAKTAREITASRHQQYSSEEQELIKASIERYSGYAGHIYISEGKGNTGPQQVRETLDKHIQFTGNHPVVFIDCLQLLAPYDPCSTEKQNNDKAVLELKRISRDYKLPILAISCFKPQAYISPASLEVQESWASDYSSDVVIGLQAIGAGEKDLDSRKAKKRKIELMILKNRYGPTGQIIFYDYYPMFNCFEEVPVSI